MKKMFTFLATAFISVASYAQFTVTYQVDITGYLAGGATLSPNGIRVGGTFGTNQGSVAAGPMVDWTPSDANSAMTDLGNNIWSIDVTL